MKLKVRDPNGKSEISKVQDGQEGSLTARGMRVPAGEFSSKVNRA
ncbi:hypothetical protein [Cytobacillus sp. NCCP-133]|nr:hypothetical protein [Cytobacillus sp. NCCP-133]